MSRRASRFLRLHEAGLAGAVLTGSILWLAGPPSAAARLTRTEPIAVRILLDNSGSMWPGYEPGSGVTKNDAGAPFFRELPGFRDWLRELVAHQGILNGNRIDFWTSTSGEHFQRSDVVQVHSQVPLDQLDVDSALDRIQGWGRKTYLAESVRTATRDFEGLLWLITDNIVETAQGEPDQDVKSFFEQLRDTDRYRSIHLFKRVVKDPGTGLQSALAVYGILVTDDSMDDRTTAFFDRKFRESFRVVSRRTAQGIQHLFPGQEHLKLKDLDIAPFDLQLKPELEAEISSSAGVFTERQMVGLPVRGTIRSNLTQHSVTSGQYTLRVLDSFKPTDADRERYGVSEIPASWFEPHRGSLESTIPPTGSRPLDATVKSEEPIPLKVDGLWNWIRSALSGVEVRYTGKVQLSFSEIRVHFERDQMSGIFGTEAAADVFDFTDVSTIRPVPVVSTVGFVLRTSGRRGAILMLVIFPFLAVAGFVTWMALQTETYRVKVGEAEKIVSLRRLGRQSVHHEGRPLGELRRDLLGDHRFVPGPSTPGLRVEPAAQEGHFRAHLENVGIVPISIEVLRASGSAKPARGARGALRRPPSQKTREATKETPPTSSGPAPSSKPRPKVRGPR